MMWGYGFGWGWLMMAFGTVLWIALLVVLVWALIRWLNTRTSTPVPLPTSGVQSGPSAEEILRRVWDEYADPFSTSVKTTISRLRSKLGPA